MPHPVSAVHVAAVRRFNRFYTAHAALLDERHLGSGFSLAEVRLLFELAHRGRPTAAELCRDLGLDAGYVSRVLRHFRRHGLVVRTPSPADGREALLALTSRGRAALAPLERGAGDRVRAMLEPVPASAQAALIASLGAIERALRGAQEGAATRARISIRRPRPGDLGWVVHRHGALYAAEYGYDARFEGLVAKIVGEFVESFDPERERCWIAEQGGAPVGCVFLVRKSDRVAKLRLLLIEPSARGQGLGARLVHACTTFARAASYRAIELWTQSELRAARALYEREGYRLVATKRHAMFGRKAVAETWRLDLPKTVSRQL